MPEPRGLPNLSSLGGDGPKEPIWDWGHGIIFLHSSEQVHHAGPITTGRGTSRSRDGDGPSHSRQVLAVRLSQRPGFLHEGTVLIRVEQLRAMILFHLDPLYTISLELPLFQHLDLHTE